MGSFPLCCKFPVSRSCAHMWANARVCMLLWGHFFFLATSRCHPNTSLLMFAHEIRRPRDVAHWHAKAHNKRTDACTYIHTHKHTHVHTNVDACMLSYIHTINTYKHATSWTWPGYYSFWPATCGFAEARWRSSLYICIPVLLMYVQVILDITNVEVCMCVYKSIRIKYKYIYMYMLYMYMYICIYIYIYTYIFIYNMHMYMYMYMYTYVHAYVYVYVSWVVFFMYMTHTCCACIQSISRLIARIIPLRKCLYENQVVNKYNDLRECMNGCGHCQTRRNPPSWVWSHARLSWLEYTYIQAQTDEYAHIYVHTAETSHTCASIHDSLRVHMHTGGHAQPLRRIESTPHVIYMHACTRTHTCIYTKTHTHNTHIRTQKCMHTHLHRHEHVYTYACTLLELPSITLLWNVRFLYTVYIACACMYTSMYMYVCMYVCICVYVCMLSSMCTRLCEQACRYMDHRHAQTHTYDTHVTP